VSPLQRRLAFAALAVVFVAQLTTSLVIVSRTYGSDFGKLYFGWHQASPYARSPASLDVWHGYPEPWYRNLNPPHVFLIVWPLSFLPVRAAWMCWFLLQIAAMGLLVAYTVRRGSGSGWPAARSR
jgi:hypothetical protein